MVSRTRDEERELIAMLKMPEDYQPKTEMSYVCVDFEFAEMFNAMTFEQVGKTMNYLIQYAVNGEGFDSEPDCYVRGVAALLCKAHDRRKEKYRRQSYGRSAANGGGRPSKNL